MREVRFRDILACQKCRKILKDVLKRTFEKSEVFKDVNLEGLRVIAKEFPLVRDKVGYQIRYIDVLAINSSNDLFIIELKKKYKKKADINKINEQVAEYEILLRDNITDLRNREEFLSIFHYYQLELFSYMNIAIGEINRIYKVILFIHNSIDQKTVETNEIPIGSFEVNELNELAKIYVNFQIDRINELTPGFDGLLRHNCFSSSSEVPTFRPIPLTAYDDKEEPVFRFESLNTRELKIIKIDISKVDPTWSLPKIYQIEFGKIDENDIIEKFLEGEYRIQIFRSGRANPIFYFEYNEARYIAFHQTKSRLLLKKDLVNRIISYDDTGLGIYENKKTIFEDVILFDEGFYNTQIIDEYGVKLKKFHLSGAKYNIEFEMIGPKLKNNLSPPLLPFMESKKIKKQIEDYKRLYNINPFSNEWITTILRVKEVK